MSFSKSFNVDRSSFLVNSMIALRIVLQNFFQLFEFKILAFTYTEVNKYKSLIWKLVSNLTQ